MRLAIKIYQTEATKSHYPTYMLHTLASNRQAKVLASMGLSVSLGIKAYVACSNSCAGDLLILQLNRGGHFLISQFFFSSFITFDRMAGSLGDYCLILPRADFHDLAV